jgi:hypothetical protein
MIWVVRGEEGGENEECGRDGDGGEEGMLDGTWAPAIANGQISHGQRRYPIVTANAGRCFVTGARDGHSDYRIS